MAEKDEIRTYSKGQRRFLKRRVCGLCEHRMDHAGCGAIYRDQMKDTCTLETRRERRKACLATYKPRTAKP